MSAVLFSKTGLLAGAKFEISNEATIGKSNSNKIVLYPEIVSSNHARIFFDDDEKSYFIEDLNSSNGTKVDGITVRNIEKLDKLHIITFAGKFDFIFQVSGSLPKEVPGKKTEPAPVSTPEPGQKEAEKTMLADFGSSLPQGLPGDLGKKKPPEKPAESDMEKTLFEQPGGLPGALAKKKPPEQPAESDMEKTQFEQPGGLPGALAKKDPPTKPADPVKPAQSPEEQKTVMADQADAPLPNIGQNQQSPPSSDEATVAMPQDKIPVAEKYYLVIESLGKRFLISKGTNKIGRTVESDIAIQDKSISRVHAIITLSPDGLSIEDNGSRNHTFIDSKQISSKISITTSSEIKLGDVIVKIIKE